MIPLLRSHFSEIEELCHRYGVASLAVFGSGARGRDFDPATSDLDFLASFEHPERPGYARRFLAFAESLEKTLGRPVDVVTRRSIHGTGWEVIIEKDLERIYEASAQ